MTLAATRNPPPESASPAASTARLPWYVVAVLFAAASTIVGVIWDISWHRSIGRDTFWTPAHLAIYLGGIVAGIACGWLVLEATFGRSSTLRDSAVGFWGFRAPLGAWLCIWGALAMLTSAPLDNWWHNAYGLDVRVLSPPHTLLALGMLAIQLGALLLVLAQQNRLVARGTGTPRLYGVMVAFVAAILLQNAGILGIEQIGFANDAHNALYYKFSAAVFPIVLVATARCARLRWPATTAAAWYMAISFVMIWTLELFPATPKLAPVFNPLTHMIPATFPLLLVFPAAAIDVLTRRVNVRNTWLLSVVTACAFLAVFLLVQWFSAYFLLSPAARNDFFGVDHWDYSNRVGPWRYEFWRDTTDPVTLRALAVATLIAFLSTRIGVWWGDWMSRVRR
ncbi:MAG TPA: hypothetical protein VLT79_06840 [Gemmatimonadales bacterium]|nr:hypothetical protein [Gemmatimonadales bacterium]